MRKRNLHSPRPFAELVCQSPAGGICPGSASKARASSFGGGNQADPASKLVASSFGGGNQPENEMTLYKNSGYEWFSVHFPAMNDFDSKIVKKSFTAGFFVQAQILANHSFACEIFLARSMTILSPVRFFLSHSRIFGHGILSNYLTAAIMVTAPTMKKVLAMQ